MRQWIAAALTTLLIATSVPAGVDARTLERLEEAVSRADRNGDKQLDPAELTRLGQAAQRKFGAAGAAVLTAALGAADANGDGTLTAAEWAAYVEAARGEGARKKTVRLEMADGTRLATDIYLPKGDGPWPVVLSRTPYGRESVAAMEAAPGAVLVVQDMRGRGDSQGRNIPFWGCGWHDHADGAETLVWIRKQDWCNGRIATSGASAGGITQYLTAATGANFIAGQYIVVGAPSLYHHAAYTGGALRKALVQKWVASNRFDDDTRRLYLGHPAYDDWWQRFDAVARADKVACPGVHVGGWFDVFSQGTIDGFVSRQTRGAAGARGRQKLVMGPWGHAVGAGRIGQMQFPSAHLPAAYSRAAFLAHVLRGADNGFDKLPAVTYYVMGDTGDPTAPGNEWRTSDSWPVKATATPWHLYVDGSLSAAAPADAAEGKDHRAYTFDPRKPCPTRGGCNLFLPAGPYDQRSVEQRGDVLVWTSEPLAAPVEVTGNVVAKLWLSSSAADTDISVRFSDVYPDGRSMLMAEGMLRLRYRDGFDKARPLPRDEVVQVEVPCWATSIAVNKGHRIRITITSSNYPRFDVNPGVLGDGPGVVQTNRIYCTPQRPSQVVLPVVAAGRQ